MGRKDRKQPVQGLPKREDFAVMDRGFCPLFFPWHKDKWRTKGPLNPLDRHSRDWYGRDPGKTGLPSMLPV